MDFLTPYALWMLLLVPLLLAGYIWAQRRRSHYALRYSSLTLVRDAIGKSPGKRRHVPPALFLLGSAALLIGLARPFSWVTLASREATVILTLDISGSMRAQDIKPSRIEASKTAAREFVERQGRNTRIGVVSFSGSSAVVAEPTTDKDAVIKAIERLSTQRATAIGSGILTALDAIAEALGQDMPTARETPLAAPDRRTGAVAPKPAAPKPPPVPKGEFAPAIIVLLTDGQNTTGPLPMDAAQVAADRGIRIYTIGLGTTDGVVMGAPGGGFGGQGAQGGGFGGGGGFRAVLDETTLRKIAKLTDAKYYYAATETDLREIYQALDTSLVVKPRQDETTVFATAAGAGLFLLGGLLSLLWFNRLP